MHFVIIDLRAEMAARETMANLTGDPTGCATPTEDEWDARVTVEPSAEAPHGFVHTYE